METIIEIAKYTVPAIVVMLTSYFTIKTFLERESDKEKSQYRLNNAKLITPIRIQAYERLVLFLERISPETLIVRVFQPGMSAQQLHQALLLTIRTEYEHNLAQQIYITEETWEIVKTTKESILRLINTVAASPRAQANSQEFSKLVLEAYNTVETNPTDNAIEKLKNEISEHLF